MTPEEWSIQQRQGKDPRRQIQGYKSRAVGKNFEDFITASCKDYDERNVAFIEKTPEPMKIIRPQEAGRFITCFAKSAQPDYKGTLFSGRSVCFEAKHTDSDRILQSAVTEEQEKCLDRHESMGAICFVLVSIQLQHFFRVPWCIWKEMKLYFGHKYMSVDELKQYRVPQLGYKILFLDGLERVNQQ